MAWTALVAIALAAGLVWVASQYYEDTAAAVFMWIRNARLLIVGVFAFITALVFVGSGSTGLMLVGFGILVYIFAALVFEENVSDLIDGVMP